MKNYQQEWQAVEALLKENQKVLPLSGYIRDGVVNVEKWQRQQIRPLFIGKEAYGDGGWSITEHGLNEQPAEFCRRSPRSWRKTSYISYALQNEEVTYSSLHPIRHTTSVAESLRSIAFINVGKQGGGKTTSSQRLQDLYAQNRRFLHEQIRLCQPNVIIGWQTLDLFKGDPEFMSQFGRAKVDVPTIGNARGWHSDGILFIATTHPAYFKVPTQRYVDSIVSLVRANDACINKDLPSW